MIVTLTGCSGGSSSPQQAGPTTLQSISVAPATASVAKGLNQSFTATGHYSDGTTHTLPLVSWSSSAAELAPVDSGIGLAQGVLPGGPVTITATDATSGLSGTASLTVTAAALQSIALSPSVTRVPVGFGRQFSVIGRYSDGTEKTILTGVTFSSSDGAVASVSGSGAAQALATGASTITASLGTLSATAALTVIPPPVVHEDPANFAGGPLDGGGVGNHHVSGLTAGVEYLVRVTSSDADTSLLLADVHSNASFDAPICQTWVGGPACRVGAAPASGDYFVSVSGAEGRHYSVAVEPLPTLTRGAAATAGATTTETYFKAALAGTSFQVTLDGLTDPFADVFVYDQPFGPDFIAPVVCSTVTAQSFVGTSSSLAPKSCIGAVPLSGVVYVTVESWLTDAGASFTVAVQ